MSPAAGPRARSHSAGHGGFALRYGAGMRNPRELRRLAEEAGLPLTKQLRAWDSEGRLVVLEVDRPAAELLEELRALGVL